MTNEILMAYNAWRKAADRGYGDKPYDTPGRMARIDNNIRRLHEKYDRLVEAAKLDTSECPGSQEDA